MAKKIQRSGVSVKAAINQIKVDSLPSFYYTGGASIIPYGTDNLYPDRILDAIKKSPTAKGCVKRTSEFIYGHGVENDFIVNRYGETLNDVLNQCIMHGYCTLGGFGLHYNFNALGEIVEVFFVSMENIRIHRDLMKVEYGIWDTNAQSIFLDSNNVTVDIYKTGRVFEQIKEAEGINNYKGAVSLFSKDLDIYPTSPLDSASISASFEREAQIYPYANIKNGFSGNTIIKLPSMSSGDELDEEVNTLQESLKSLHGAENSGSSVVVTSPVDMQGKASPYTMVEHLSPTNVDTLFVNQNEKAERDILKCFTMPEILLGISSQGMFNEGSFVDAFNYKNADTEGDRKILERYFNKWLQNSAFDVKEIEIRPLEMKQKEGAEKITIKEDNGENKEGVSDEQLKAQASLKGSVGGVQGILQIQQSFAQGLTDKESAMSILTLIYGFTTAEADALLGDPDLKKEGSNNQFQNG